MMFIYLFLFINIISGNNDVKIILIHSYYYEKNDTRRGELETVLSLNANNNYVNKIYLLIETKQFKLFENYDFLPIQSNKIVLIPVSKQPTYQQLFQYANEIMKNNTNTIVVIQNSDIVCTESIRYAVCVKENQVYALSRYERPCGSSNYQPEQCNRYESSSHDLFIFKSPIPEPIIQQLNFTQNHWGAENVVIYQLKKGSFDVINPCYTIQCVHNHCSGEKHTPRQRIDNERTHGTSQPTMVNCFFSSL